MVVAAAPASSGVSWPPATPSESPCPLGVTVVAMSGGTLGICHSRDGTTTAAADAEEERDWSG